MFYQRKSLVCDVVEPFRCIIDKQVKKSYNLGQVKQDDFIIKNGKYILLYEKNKEYTKWLLEAVLAYNGFYFINLQLFSNIR